MRKRDYYDRHPLFKTGAQILMVYGQNCNGKSYQAKEEIIERALRGEKTFLLRRYPDDIRQNKAQMYFDDMPVNKLTNGEWDSITAYQSKLYFQRVDENGNKERSEHEIGYFGSLSEWQRYKSMAFVNYTLMVFEEFITDSYYLTDEPLLLMRLMTTVFRDKPGTVLMIGNTISRTVPYFMQWTPGVIKQAQGTIEIYHYHDEDEGTNVDIAVEYAGHIKGTGALFFGNAAKSINKGEWFVESQPRLPKELFYYENIYELAIAYQTFSFVLQLLVDPEEGTKLLYVYPRTTDRKIERVITDKFSDSLMVTRYWRDIRPELYIREAIANKRVVYSDNLTASDFNSVIEQMGLT